MAQQTGTSPPAPPQQRLQVPIRQLNTDYPLIDSDPHFRRVLRYARRSDYAWGAGLAVGVPAAHYAMAVYLPTPGVPFEMHRGPMRMAYAVGLMGGFVLLYTRSQNRFYGLSENRREIDMDMREMTDRVKRGETPYGESQLTEHMQGVAARQSRYSGLFSHIMPWANFVNHPHHGVDTAKYYQNAERELEAETELR